MTALKFILKKSPIDSQFSRLFSADRIDLTQLVQTADYQNINEFMRRLHKYANEHLPVMMDAAGKISLNGLEFGYQLKKTAEEISQNTEMLESIKEAMSDSAKAVGDISCKVEEFSQFMQSVDEISNTAMQVVEEITKDVSDSVSAMQKNREFIQTLKNNISSINSIVDVINEIADQTNLLALNAAIEAARAGEAGRGFAVVADEIRKLAEKTQKNAEQISDMIEQIGSNVGHLIERNLKVSRNINKSGKTAELLKENFVNLKNQLDAAQQMVSEITASIEEQSATIEEVNRTVEESTGEMKKTVDGLNKVLQKQVDPNEVTRKSLSTVYMVKINHWISDVYEIILQARDEVKEFLEDALRKGLISSADLWDRNYIPISNTNPQRYKTRYTEFFKRYIQDFEDKYLAKHPKFTFFLVMDNNGYVAVHNSKYDKPLTGDPEKDLVGNRSMRIFDDEVGMRAIKNTEPFFVQTYLRDTGESIYDASMPLFIEGKHWGVVRAGLLP